ncbi:MAG: DUF58 domain-containing protein [Promicromonosporaceae bacterium]|nr:DUF58 domain-containing protein [Promicromonosporaceae bacterium]
MVSPARGLLGVRPTLRGTALLAGVVTLGVTGRLGGIPELFGVAVALFSLLLIALASLGLRRLESGRAALQVRRTIAPNPVVRGEDSTVSLRVSPLVESAAALERLWRLQLSEQAPPELLEDGARSRVTTGETTITVDYHLKPTRRGRWPLGPLRVSSLDAFGLARSTTTLGEPLLVTVWPRTSDLESRARLLGDIDQTGSGSRLASADDAVLREYVPGDDPRRVHWPTAARLGELMVRADEAAGVRPVTVLFDLALLGEEHGEWALELAASIACSLLGPGYSVRLIPSALGPDGLGGHPAVTGAETGRPAILNSTVDLAAPATPAAATEGMAATVRALRDGLRRNEAYLAVLGPCPAEAWEELAALGTEASAALAITIAAGSPAGSPAEAALRAGGWQVCQAVVGADHSLVWGQVREIIAGMRAAS